MAIARPEREESPRHLRQLIGVVAVLIAITSLPYLYASLSTPRDLVYTGLMFDVPDHAQYWSWVTASRKALFINNMMTPEPNAPLFMNPTMWALARIQMTLGLSFPSLFQVWRLIAIALLVPALWAFSNTMVLERERRSTAFLIALLGSGFGWSLIMAKKLAGGADAPWPNDLYTVEPNTFWALLGYPYITLAHALILLTMLNIWLAHRRKMAAPWLLAAGAATCLSISHAYDLITVYAVLGMFGIVVWIRQRRFPARLALIGIVIVACSGPMALYYQRMTTSDPLWQAILRQYANAGVWTPPHAHLVVLMGLPLVLAVIAVLSRGAWSEERIFIVTWAAVGLVLIYLPVVYQIKLLSGWQFPIAILAAHAWHEGIARRAERLLPSRWAFAVLLLLVGSTNAYLFVWRFVELRRHSEPYYLHRDSMDALSWLSTNSGPADVVLAPADVGRFVPNYGASRSYLAHWAMTNRFFERRSNVETFFSPETAPEWRARLMNNEHITLVLQSDWPPSTHGVFDPGSSADMLLIFTRPHAKIYRFSP
jgi:hypothetical protein